MDIETLPVVMAVAGLVLLYGAIFNKNPVEVVRLALTGKDPSTAKPIATPPPPAGGILGPDRDPNEPGNQGYLAPGPGDLGGNQPPPLAPGQLPPGTV